MALPVLWRADSARRNLERGVLVGFCLVELPTLLLDYAAALWVADSIPDAEPLLGTVPWPVEITGIP